MNSGSVRTEMSGQTAAKTFVAVAGPSLISLVPMAVAPALPAMAQRFAQGGDGALFAQMVMAVPALMIIVAASLSGFLAERLGRRTVLLSGLLLYALAGLACLIVPDAGTLIAARLVLGFAAGAVMTSSLSLVADFPEGASRDRVLGFASAGAAVMAVFALTLGGLLVEAFGWRGPFALYALALPVFVVALRAVKSVPRAPNDAENSRRRVLPMLWPVYVLALVLTIGLFMPGVQGPFLLQAEGVTNAATQGMILASYSLTAAVVAACYGRIAGLLGMRWQIAAAALGLGLGGIAMALLHGGALTLALGCIITGAGAGLVEPVTVSLVLQRAPAALQTRAIGLLLSAVFLGQFLNPLVVDPLRSGLGIHGAFIVVGVAFLALSALALLGGLGRLANPGVAGPGATPQSTPR
ncbi:MAG TPA: MFS transporter [Burkholderiaceae bacterium]|nr:MFS transporter [Burkholderiaceae bacterium]